MRYATREEALEKGAFASPTWISFFQAKAPKDYWWLYQISNGQSIVCFWREKSLLIILLFIRKVLTFTYL